MRVHVYLIVSIGILKQNGGVILFIKYTKRQYSIHVRKHNIYQQTERKLSHKLNY